MQTLSWERFVARQVLVGPDLGFGLLLLPREVTKMIWTVFVILVVLWLAGFLGHVGGSLIHLVLVVAVIVLIFNLLSGRRGLA
jgi:hypothetical protein